MARLARKDNAGSAFGENRYPLASGRGLYSVGVVPLRQAGVVSTWQVTCLDGGRRDTAAEQCDERMGPRLQGYGNGPRCVTPRILKFDQAGTCAVNLRTYAEAYVCSSARRSLPIESATWMVSASSCVSYGLTRRHPAPSACADHRRGCR